MYSDAGAILQILRAAVVGCEDDRQAVTTRESAGVYILCTNLEATVSMMRGAGILFKRNGFHETSQGTALIRLYPMVYFNSVAIHRKPQHCTPAGTCAILTTDFSSWDWE